MPTAQPRRAILVTGSATDIGAATARRFISEGWQVAVNCLDASQREAASAVAAGAGCFCADILAQMIFKDQATPYLPFIDVVVGGLVAAAALSTSRRKLFP